LGLPCLNHACDSTTAVMSDLFGTSYPALQSAARRKNVGSAENQH